MVERQEVRQEYVKFSSTGINLEGILHMPAGDGPFPGVVVCHPHPLYGGSMDNNVVMAISQGLARKSMAVLRFNFRGVGSSEGRHDEGVGEQRDVVAALVHLGEHQNVDPRKLGLAGYSFGTKVAAPVALGDRRIRALALVSPFLGVQEWEQLARYKVPKLFLSGNQDGFISDHELVQWTERLPHPSFCSIVPGADHMWWGYEGEVADRVSEFFASYLTVLT